MSSIIKTGQRGFTLVEAIVYAAGMVLVIGAIAGFLYYMYGWYYAATQSPRVDQAAVAMMDKIEGDVRAANTVNAAVNGTLSVTSTANSVSTTTAYTLSNGRLYYQLNSNPSVPLSPAGMTVSSFIVSQILTPVSTAIRYEVDISYSTKAGTTTNAYDGLAILRQSYQ